LRSKNKERILERRNKKLFEKELKERDHERIEEVEEDET